MSRLYDTDFYAWTQEQAALLEGKHFEALDLKNLVEEIDSLGKSEQRAMASYWDVLLLHLLKWCYQPEHRSGSWRGSITNARQQLVRLGRENPSLWRRRLVMLEDIYPDARRVAAAETGLALDTFPVTCPWDGDQVLHDAFFPEAP
jgi:hypothetical protein